MPESIECDISGIEVGGWIDMGYTANADDPANRFNGPVTFNDRSDEFQMNQLWLYSLAKMAWI